MFYASESPPAWRYIFIKKLSNINRVFSSFSLETSDFQNDNTINSQFDVDVVAPVAVLLAQVLMRLMYCFLITLSYIAMLGEIVYGGIGEPFQPIYCINLRQYFVFVRTPTPIRT